MRQPSVADQNAEPAGVQVTFARGGNAVVDRGKTQGVAGAMPAGPLQRESRGHSPVDIREFIRLHIADGFAEARKEAQVPGQLLLDIEARTGATAVPAHRSDVDRSGARGEPHGVIEESHPAAAVEDGERYSAGEGGDCVAPLQFDEDLKFVKAWVAMR